MAVNLSIPDISDEFLDNTRRYVSQPWYRFLELMEKQLQTFFDSITTNATNLTGVLARVTALETLTAAQTTLINALDARISALEGVPDPMVSFEDFAADDLVNIYSNAGVTTARKADATDETKPANGYVKVASFVGAGVLVYRAGRIPIVGLTPGKAYLSTTPGLAVSAPPLAAGNLRQLVGTATATDLWFAPEEGTY